MKRLRAKPKLINALRSSYLFGRNSTKMQHYWLFCSKALLFLWGLSVLSSCAVLSPKNEGSNYCASLTYFLEQDARLAILDRADSDMVYGYNPSYAWLADCVKDHPKFRLVWHKRQLPKQGGNLYRLEFSELNVNSKGDGVALTFIRLGEGPSYEVIVVMEAQGPLILNVREFTSDKR